jgi:hypothetical protein
VLLEFGDVIPLELGGGGIDPVLMLGGESLKEALGGGDGGGCEVDVVGQELFILFVAAVLLELRLLAREYESVDGGGGGT